MLTETHKPHDEDEQNPPLDVEWVFAGNERIKYSVRAEKVPV